MFFHTDYEEFQYATYGGTLFVVEYEGRLFALTCQHVFKDFPRERLFITAEKQAKKGSKPAPIKGFCNPSAPKGGAVDTDIVDLCIIELADDLASSFFGHTAYVINESTVGTAKEGAPLLVAGVLKEKTEIALPDIRIGYCRLQFQDNGAYKPDPFLREAITEFGQPEFSSIVGISGSPVFDMAQERLCGMVMRGGMKDKRSFILYFDIMDILVCLKMVRSGAREVAYTKGINVRVGDQPNFLEGGPVPSL